MALLILNSAGACTMHGTRLTILPAEQGEDECRASHLMMAGGLAMHGRAVHWHWVHVRWHMRRAPLLLCMLCKPYTAAFSAANAPLASSAKHVSLLRALLWHE